MATIVWHERTQANYVLLGAGFGAYKSTKPNWLFGDLVADTSSGKHALVCVANAEDKIGWIEASQLTVVGGRRSEAERAAPLVVTGPHDEVFALRLPSARDAA